MPKIILLSVISICAALLFYTAAVWWNFFTKRLKGAQAVLLALGLVTDIAATSGMAASVKGEMRWDLHTLSGYTALALMFLVTVVGGYAVLKDNEPLRRRFHTFSLPVWFIWMISWVTGVVLGLQKY